MPPAFPGCVIAPLVEMLVSDRPWLCEFSAAAILPVGGADNPGAEAGDDARGGVARTTVRRFRVKECGESIIAPFSPLLLSSWALHAAFRL